MMNKTDLVNGLHVAEFDADVELQPGWEKTHTKAKKVDREYTMAVYYGQSIEEMVEMYGEAAVVDAVRRRFRVDYQNATRALLLDGVADENLVAEMKTFIPGVPTKRTRKVAAPTKESFAQLLKNMTEEERAAYLAEVMASFESDEDEDYDDDEVEDDEFEDDDEDEVDED